MFHTDHRTLVDRGRKAGLGTADIYHAISARPPEGHEPVAGQTDGNGFTLNINSDGRREFRPNVTLVHE